jgi:hypothetical protein
MNLQSGEESVLKDIDYIKLIQIYGDKQIVNWTLLDSNFQKHTHDYDSSVLFEKLMTELEDEFGNFCYLQIDGINIHLDNNFYDFQIIIKYYFGEKFNEFNEVDCSGGKCRRYFPRCRERHCSSCYGDFNYLYTSKKLELCFIEIKCTNSIILTRNYGLNDDYSDSDSDNNNETIKIIFDGTDSCYLSSLNLNNNNIYKINLFIKK